MRQLLQKTIDHIFRQQLLNEKEIHHAKFLLNKHEPVVLHYGKEEVALVFGKDNPDVADVLVSIIPDSDDQYLLFSLNNKLTPWNSFGLASLQYLKSFLGDKTLVNGQKYTKEGMRRRVWHERLDKAKKASYQVKLAENLFGEHTLINEKGKTHHITLWDFDKKTGYIDNIDWKTNKLGTTKHILYLYDYLEKNPIKTQNLTREFPFIEVFTDPFNDYRISWFYKGTLDSEETAFLNSFFGNKNYLTENELTSFLPFLEKARAFDRIKIREEVYETLEAHYERRELKVLQEKIPLDYSSIQASLYPFQKEGVAFSVYKSGVIIADEMGLGKTLQAITTAVLKKDIFGFKKTLVISPSSVKHQWQNEILKFTSEKVTIIHGSPEEREVQYATDKAFFHIINYETVLRDLKIINQSDYDFVILDEAQKIKNYESKTAIAIKQISKKHGLVITGTPLENKLLDLYSIVQFLDQGFLSPQWEFSYQYCVFDRHTKNKIVGYYNLQGLKERLSDILIRREKHEVFEQLPQVVEKDVFVTLSQPQAELHAEYKRNIAKILSKNIKTTYDWQRLMMLLTNMRMVCNSTFLIDKQTHHSPKMVELREILVERLQVKNTQRKVIIFSEWITMLELIGNMLQKEGIEYRMLSGKVPIKKRQGLLKEFEEQEDCKILLSSETGGAGLNLQAADTVINFELPWNPAKKNQRLGRIDRIGQQQKRLHVFNLLSYNSIELGISKGLILKQSLFDSILSEDNIIDKVDFSEKGKSEFLHRLEEVMQNDGSPAVQLKIDLDPIDDSDDLIEPNVQSDILPIQNESVTPNGNVVTNEQHDISESKFLELEKMLRKGLDFVNTMYELSHGKELSATVPEVDIDKQTGEVSITFKLNKDE